MITGQNIQSEIQTQVKFGKYNAACVLSIRRIITAIRFVAFMMAVLASVCVKAQTGLTGQTEIIDTTVVSATVDIRFDFKVNATNIDPTYRNNDAQLTKALARINSMVLNPQMKVSRITVVGIASPEGTFADNKRLSTGRAEAFIRILKDRYSFPDSMYVVSAIPEDWEGMRSMLVGNDTIPYAKEVLTYLDRSESFTPYEREARLKSLDKGRPYVSMYQYVFPCLRRTLVQVDYDTEWLKRRYLEQQKQRQELKPAFVDVKPIQFPQPDIVVPTSEIRPLDIPASRKQRFIAVKTNLLGDAALCANLGVEIGLWRHWSLDVPVWYSPYDITNGWRIRLLATQPEVRYWLKDTGEGHYFGVHATVAGFNVSMGGDYRYQDPNHAAFGAGIGYGYAFHLDKSRRWSMEAQIGAGYIGYEYIKYHNTGRNGAEVSRGKGTYWGVTRAGFAVAYKFYTGGKGRRGTE